MTPSPEQLSFIDERAFNVIVVAIPGAGKTSALVAKLTAIVENDQTVIGASFTKEAADEWREKAFSSIPPGRWNQCRIGTFHSLALQELRAIPGSPVQGRKLVTNGPATEQRVIALEAIGEPVNHETLSWFEHAYSCLADPYGTVAAEKLPLDDPLRASSIQLAKKRQRMISIYEDGLRKNKLFDLSRVLLTALEYVEQGHPLFRTDHLLVDEFQDVDEVQLRLIILLAQTRRVDVVGDDDQSIYRFRRGLGYRAFQALRAELPHRWIVFSRNFRSKGWILRWAERVIENNQHRYPKKLHASRGPGGDLRLIQLDHDGQENSIVARLVRTSVDNGVKRVAIIARTNSALVEIQPALMRQEVVFHTVSCDSIWDLQPCSTVVALLEALAAPHDAIVGLEHALHAYGAHGEEIVLMRDTKCRSMIEAFDMLCGVRRISASCRTAMDRLTSLLHRVGYPNSHKSDEQTEWVLSVVFQDVADAVANDRRLSEKQRSVRLKMLRAAEDILMKWRGSLAQRLAVIRLLRKNRADVPVHLTTMHSSKGLEFDAVFIIHAADNVIPGRDETPAALEEERRLLYVGMTRARDELTITCSRKYGAAKWTPSTYMTRFLHVEGSPPEECFQDYEWILRS